MYFTFSESAKKDIKKLPKPIQNRLKSKLLIWQDHKDPLEFAKRLTQHKEATHRFRIGAYRIIVKIVGDEMLVLRVRHRKDVYK